MKVCWQVKLSEGVKIGVLYSTISAVYSPPGCGRSRGSWRGRAWAPAPGRGGPPWRAPAGEWSVVLQKVASEGS